MTEEKTVLPEIYARDLKESKTTTHGKLTLHEFSHPKKIPPIWIDQLFVRFNNIWGRRWIEHLPDGISDEMVIREWSEGLAGIEGQEIKAALDHCRLNLEWPPSIAEFRKICLMSGGVLSPDEIMQRAVSRDFSHPLTKMVYDKVGSWAFQHDTEKALADKIKNVCKFCVSEFSADPEYARRKLQEWKLTQQKQEKEILKGATICSPENDKKLVGNFYLDAIQSTLGKQPKHLTEEERQNVIGIIAQAGLMKDPLEGKTVQEWYDANRKEGEKIASEFVRQQQVAAKKVEERMPPRTGAGKPQQTTQYWNRD